MNPALAGLLGTGIVGGYVPTLRRQIRAGAIAVGHLGMNTIYVRRAERPLAFRIVRILFPAALALLLAASAMLIVQAVRA